MRIAFVVDQFPSLSQTFILRQITGLLDRGHAVDIFAFSPTTDSAVHEDVAKYNLLKRTYYFPPSDRGRVFRLLERLRVLPKSVAYNPIPVFNSLNLAKFGKRAVLLQVFSQIAPFLNKDPYDIVHCQFGPLGEVGLLLKEAGVFYGKVVTSFRGYDISSYVQFHGRGIYNDLFNRGDLFLCVSDHIKRLLIELGCDHRKITVHRSGVDTKRHSPRPQALNGDGRIRILTVARLTEKKGVEYGIRAITEALRHYQNIEYKIAGDGPLRERLQTLIVGLNVAENVKLLGWKSQGEIADLLQNTDILLAPSVTTQEGDAEGIPGVIMEAFAHGIPVLSTRHAGIPEVVHDGESGFLLPERDVNGLAHRLTELIEQPHLRLEMGSRGRKVVEEHFNIDMLNDRLVRLYHGEVEHRAACTPMGVQSSHSAIHR